MSDAPERIWTCSHVGEYGNYFPEAVEAEGEYGGTATEYIRSDLAQAMVAKAREDALREAAEILLGTIRREYGDHRDYRKAILALIEKDKP